MPICANCNSVYPNTVKIEGIVRNLSSRKYCLECSPFGEHNTRKILLGVKQLRPYKIVWPELTVLIEKLKTFSYLQLGKELGVSDQAIRKHLKYFNIDPKKVKFL